MEQLKGAKLFSPVKLRAWLDTYCLLDNLWYSMVAIAMGSLFCAYTVGTFTVVMMPLKNLAQETCYEK